MGLQPLRIPSGWTVSWNTMPELELSEDTISDFGSSSLIMLYNPSANRLIDVCWHPENDMAGAFLLKVCNCLEVFNGKTHSFEGKADWDSPVIEYKTTCKKEVIEKLEEVLQTIAPYKDPRILIKRGVVDEASEELRLQLKENNLDTNLFNAIINLDSPKLENLLLDSPNLSMEMLKYLKEKGHNKRIKNKAQQKLNRIHN